MRRGVPEEGRRNNAVCPSYPPGLAVTTGMRRSEILKMRWLDVDLPGGRILLPQTKNGEGKIVHLNHSATTILASTAPDTETRTMDRVFSGISRAQVSVAFGRACKRAGIEDFRFHDLRHTTGSWLAMSGADILTISRVLGHKDLRMSARYSHLSGQYLGAAVNALDAVFELSRYPGVTRPKKLIEAEAVSV